MPRESERFNEAFADFPSSRSTAIERTLRRFMERKTILKLLITTSKCFGYFLPKEPQGCLQRKLQQLFRVKAEHDLFDELAEPNLSPVSSLDRTSQSRLIKLSGIAFS